MELTMDVSIIIVNWNTPALLMQCLKSIYNAGTEVAFEVIVVDNGSSDDSVSLISKHFPLVVIIENDRNLGFARANNQGIALGRGRYFMLLNSDTILMPGAVDVLVQVADQYPEVGVLGPKLLNMDNTIQKSWASFPSFLSELLGKNFRVRHPVAGSPFTYEVDWIMGACMLVRAATVDQVGTMDEDYFFYSEEIDWCFRIKKKNWKVWYISNAEIYHLGGGSANRASFAQLTRLYQGKLLYFQKYHGSFSTTLLRFGLALANTLGIVRRLIFFNWKNRQAAAQRIADQTRLVWCLLCDQYPKSG
jgi:GT2 family glycosyltransferase